MAHTTKYESLMDLAISLGYNYLKELHVADNATYHCRQIVGEFLQTVSVQVEGDSLQKLASSTYFSLMTDESECKFHVLLLYSHCYCSCTIMYTLRLV